MSGLSAVISSVVCVAMSFGGMSPEVPDTDAVEQPEPEPEPEPVEEASAGLGDALIEEALDRFVEGGEYFDERRYIEAATAYERSYAAVALGKTLYNIALSYEKGGNVVKALTAYHRYLKLPDCPAPQEHCATRREEVVTTVAKLRTKVGELSIEVDPGVDLQGIEIGDRIVPPEDFPLVLSPGHYEIRERGYGRNEVRIREIDIEPGQVFSLLVVDFNAAVPTPADARDTDTPVGPVPSTGRDEEERRRRLRIAFYSGVGATAVAGGVAAVLGALTLDNYKTFDARCKGKGVDCTGTSFPADARRQFNQLQPTTNALIGVTAALGVTTVVLGLFAFTGRKGAGARASVVRVSPGPSGIRLRF